MAYLKLSFPISESDFDVAEAMLSQAGALSVTMEDAGDAPILEPGVGETPLWQRMRISALFPLNVNQKKILNKLKMYFDESTLAQVQFEELADQAWELKWLEYFQPICFGKTLWVGVAQHQPDQTYQALIYLEPGLAFGTGSHPSTYLCLEWLSQHDVHGKTVIDYGCGSGILAIAAAKLGAREVLCVDNDPQALTATQNNAHLNQVFDQIKVFLPDELPNLTSDILLANILANPLVSLAPKFLSLLKSRGELVLAGILNTQEQMVQEAYAPQISWQDTAYKEEWLRLYGVKI